MPGKGPFPRMRLQNDARMWSGKLPLNRKITNQMIFSTASGSKWGDYDVDMDKLLKDENRDDIPPQLDFTPLHFIDQPIEVHFDVIPARQKTPSCPDGFVWGWQKLPRYRETLRVDRFYPARAHGARICARLTRPSRRNTVPWV